MCFCRTYLHKVSWQLEAVWEQVLLRLLPEAHLELQQVLVSDTRGRPARHRQSTRTGKRTRRRPRASQKRIPQALFNLNHLSVFRTLFLRAARRRIRATAGCGSVWRMQRRRGSGSGWTAARSRQEYSKSKFSSWFNLTQFVAATREKTKNS